MTTDNETKTNSTLTIKVPKPNIQVVVLGFVALITLFQTFQLLRISAQASSPSVKAAAPAVTNSGSSPASGSNTEVPASQVGGC